MRSLERDRYLARGGAAVLLALGVAAVLRGMNRRLPKMADEAADEALSPPAGE